MILEEKIHINKVKHLSFNIIATSIYRVVQQKRIPSFIFDGNSAPILTVLSLL